MEGQFLSNFMKSSKKRSKQPPEEDQEEREKFSSKLARLQLQYKEQLEICGQLSEELKRLFSKHKIASERMCLLGEEISLLVEEQSKKDRSTAPASFSLRSKSPDFESNFLFNGKDNELFGTCPLVIDAKNATESCLSKDLEAEKEHLMLEEDEVLYSPEEQQRSNKQLEPSKIVGSLSDLFDNDSFVNENQQEIPANSKQKFGEINKNAQEQLSSANRNAQEKFTSANTNEHEQFTSANRNEQHIHSVTSTKSESNSCPFTVRKTKRVAAFSRKPRFISFFPKETSSSDFMVSGSYDGILQFWTCLKDHGPRIAHTQSLNAKLSMIPEDIHWCNSGSAFAVICLSHAEKDSYLKVFSEMHTNKSGHLSGSSAIHKASMHSKPIRCISSIPSTNSLKFLTAGEDKTVLCWTFSKENIKSAPEVHHIHSGKHTSVIQCMHYDTFRNILITGGADGKLICHAIGHHSQNTEQQMMERKFLIRNRMTDIQPRPTDPNTLLLTQSTDNNQFMLFDLRSSRSIGIFGWSEAYNLSQYVKPSWHSAGNYVACGQSSTEKVNIWDIRFAPSTALSIQECTPLTTSHGNGRILNAIFHPSRSILATCSTADMNVNFIDYSL